MSALVDSSYSRDIQAILAVQCGHCDSCYASLYLSLEAWTSIMSFSKVGSHFC